MISNFLPVRCFSVSLTMNTQSDIRISTGSQLITRLNCNFISNALLYFQSRVIATNIQCCGKQLVPKKLKLSTCCKLGTHIVLTVDSKSPVAILLSSCILWLSAPVFRHLELEVLAHNTGYFLVWLDKVGSCDRSA